MYIIEGSLENEKWAHVKGFEERFLISNYGRLISINGKRKGVNFLKPVIQKSTGYNATTLRKVEHGGEWIKREVRIHVLVAEHFLIKPDIPNVCVNHLDRNRLNNHVDNLEWTDTSGNIKHAKENGAFEYMKGSKHFCAKLTEEQVITIRNWYKRGGVSHQELANLYGISRRNMGDVINGVTWSWLK